MVDVRAPATPPDPVGRRWWWVAFLVVVLLGLTGTALLGGRDGRPYAAPPAPPVTPPAPVPTSVVAAARVLPAPVRLPAPVPTRAGGKFVYAVGNGRMLGRKGPVRRFHVAVERGSGEDVAAFAAQVQATLGDRRSWVGGGRVRLQRVSQAVAADFTVFLATRHTTARMCARGGIDVGVGRMAYTSCRTTGRAIINLDRWRMSAPPYVAAKVPLAVYRQYVINHEVGHELGHHHQGCPKRGGPAPVMVQQTIRLRGCLPNAWPRVRHRELSGPPV
jgi:Protein of unknown function (DUF3152)